jgi:Kelch motif protein
VNALFQRFLPAIFFTPRALVALLFCGTTCLTVTGTQPAFFCPEAQTNVSQRSLTFTERVAYQRGIADVYWRHRIWPKENPDPKPSLDAVMSQAQLENKVAAYLRNSLVLEHYWQKLISAEQLQAEMDRMVRDTKQPEVLRELFEALGNDAFVIAECLARPLLAERLLAHSVSEQVKQTNQTDEQVVAATGDYHLPWVSDDGGCTDDTWTATSTTNAPSGRGGHTAVWTGTEMIAWGGSSNGAYLNTGGKYDPITDSWIATSTNNAPDGRSDHTAVWTGSEMIVWGGWDGGSLNTGGRYDPSTDTWTETETNGAPSARYHHTAVWTGSEMIVWGGFNFIGFVNTGGRYNPSTDSWTNTSTTNAPHGRVDHTAVWSGSEMVVWGGYDYNFLNTGGRYFPGTNSWIGTGRVNAPTSRSLHTAVWTDSGMIVWGGRNSRTGGRYCANVSQRLGNISTRAFGQTADNVVIGGFIVQGTQTKKVIIRAIGPELTQYGIPNALANPTLELHDSREC